MTLDKLRKELEEIDSEFLDLIAKRSCVSRKIGVIKKKQGLKIYHPKVEKDKLQQLEKQAKRKKINVKTIKKVFKILMTDSKRIQKEI